jgi:hypothetical protein
MADVERTVRVKIEPGEVIVQIVSVVVAILLALWVNDWRDHIHEGQLLQQSRENIRVELQHNRVLLEAERPHHSAVFRAFERMTDAAKQSHTISFEQFEKTIQDSSPRGFGPVPYESIAWTIAQSGNALSLMDYKERAGLTVIYQTQAAALSAEQRYIDTVAAPSNALATNFYMIAVNVEGALGDVVANEESLATLYENEGSTQL